MGEKIRGRCPMGCGETLFVGSGGYITCGWEKCPNPSAAGDILLDHAETHHVVELTDDHFQLQHPLRERLNGDLFDCPLHDYLYALTGPPRQPGRYHVHLGLDGDPSKAYWVVAPS